jgi:hypothetical protein
MHDAARTPAELAAAEALVRESGMLSAVQRVMHMALAENPAVQDGVAARGDEMVQQLGAMLMRQYGPEKVGALRAYFATPAGRARAAQGAEITPEIARLAERLVAEMRMPR